MERSYQAGETLMDTNERLASYLSQPGFKRLVAGWQEKYQRMGHLGGTLVIEALTDEEKTSLGLLLGMDLSSGVLKISYSKFTKLLAKTRFEGADFVEVLHLLNGDKVYTRQELKQMKIDKEQVFKQRIIDLYQASTSYAWLSDFFNHDGAYLHYFHEDEQAYEQLICQLANALNDLPCFRNEEELLAVYSEKHAQDPHYFDHGLALELLKKGIAFLLDLDENQHSGDILMAAGIMKDELSNYCPICHLEPIGNYPAWHDFSENYEPWNMNYTNIRKVQGLFRPKPVFIVENPAVFSCLCALIGHNHLNVGLVCGNGQINRCTYALLDRLYESDCQLYYAGDFDPEGLLIADKLKRRYPKLLYWCMDRGHFRKVQVKQSFISQRRIKMLDLLQDTGLKHIADTMIKDKVVGYQEGLIKDYEVELLNLKK